MNFREFCGLRSENKGKVQAVLGISSHLSAFYLNFQYEQSSHTSAIPHFLYMMGCAQTVCFSQTNLHPSLSLYPSLPPSFFPSFIL